MRAAGCVLIIACEYMTSEGVLCSPCLKRTWTACDVETDCPVLDEDIQKRRIIGKSAWSLFD